LIEDLSLLFRLRVSVDSSFVADSSISKCSALESRQSSEIVAICKPTLHTYNQCSKLIVLIPKSLFVLVDRCHLSSEPLALSRN
jgi:hypothetical protein